MRIGVLSVQGAFAEHERRLRERGVEVFEIRQLRDLDAPFDALVLPGGESTVQGKLLRDLGLFAPLRERIAAGLPTLGTCAGLILLAREIQGDAAVHFGLLDVTVERNAYGRQIGSFRATAPFAGEPDVPLVFIRAPAIRRLGATVETLISLEGQPVAVRQGNVIATAFHPELTQDNAILDLFVRQATR